MSEHLRRCERERKLEKIRGKTKARRRGTDSPRLVEGQTAAAERPYHSPSGQSIKRLPKVTFETGRAVTFPFTHRRQPTPHYGATFGQDVEPAGRYVTLGHLGDPGELLEPGGVVVMITHGVMQWRNPLVLEHRGYGADGWKRRVSDSFGNKKGKALTRALLKAGYDGIVTINAGERGRSPSVGELVELTLAKPPRQ